MPRNTERSSLVQTLEIFLDFALLQSLFNEDVDQELTDDLVEFLVVLLGSIQSTRYLHTRQIGTAGYQPIDTLSNIIYCYSDTSFRACFRVTKDAFWKIVQICEDSDVWAQNSRKEARPIYQQIAVALYSLGGRESGERTRVHMNIGHGTVWLYTDRLVTVLMQLCSRYIRWPRGSVQSTHQIFKDYVGFLDGSEIQLRFKPRDNHEQYFSRKKNYSLNLTVSHNICLYI